MIRRKIIIALIFVTCTSLSQTTQLSLTKNTVDSLQQVINTSDNDSIIVSALVKWDNLIYLEAPDLDLELNQRIEEITLKNLTSNPYNKSNLFFAQELAYALNNQGIQYENMGKISMAMDCYNRSLNIHQKTNDSIGIANAFNNIGNVYEVLERNDDAIKFYKKSLDIRLKLDDKNGVAYAKNNIANIYHAQNKYLAALQYFEQSLELFEGLDFKEGTALVTQNLGSVYISLQNYSMAHYYFEKCLKINKEINNNQGLITTYNQICDVLLSKASVESNPNKANAYYKSSIKYADSAVTYALEYKFTIQVQIAYRNLYYSYKGLGDYRNALDYHEKYFETNELLKDLENAEAINRNEFNIKIAEDSTRVAESKKLIGLELQAKNEKIVLDRTIKFLLFFGLGVLIIFGIFIYNRFTISQKQKHIIEKQKEEVEFTHVELAHKNKEILDSINYAKRIQSAILPPKDYLTSLGVENFILYEPKDIVAGDFFWIENQMNNIYIAAADCTGHGVPGALVSVVCHNALNRAVREYGLAKPGEILDKTREIVIEEFAKSDQIVNDGMDIALCLLSDNKLFFSGAHNPLWIIRHNSIIEFKADKQPVGQFSNAKKFTTHEISTLPGDLVYIFSDGYVDQFGGHKGKKFKTTSLKNLLLEINKLALHEQKKSLKKEFDRWKGALDQVDDVCIIGFKIS